MMRRDTAPVANGHEWVRDEDGEFDIFAYSEGHHNGPRCTRCDDVFCHHCEPDIYQQECSEVLAQPLLTESS